MHLGKADFPHEVEGFAEIPLRFPREADHHVRREGGVLKRSPQVPDDCQIFAGGVMAVHPLQRAVAAALQRKVKLGAELGLPPEPGDGPGVQPLRLQRTEPHAPDAVRFAGGFHRVAEREAEFLPVGGEVDAGQDDFPVAVRGDFGGLPPEVPQRFGADPAARVGDDAVGAEPVAPVLDFHKGARPLVKAADAHRLEFSGVGGDVDNPAAV